MDFAYTNEQLEWRAEIREFLAANVTDGLRKVLADHGGESRSVELDDFRSKIGAKGWYGINWPKEFGGLALSAIHQNILVNEFQYWGVPGPDLTVTSVAPMIMRFGTDDNRKDFLPGIARGEITVAVGYSEPNSGTDLASLKTKAELDGDEWVINGQKIWNSLANVASHEWLCVRTDPDAPKHRGISVIMVPIDSPGIEIRPLITWGDFRTNETFFTDVRVPKRNLIGEINRGWQYITGALDFERGALAHTGGLRREVDELLAFFRTGTIDGARPVNNPDLRRKVAQLDSDVEQCELMTLEAASLVQEGKIPTVVMTAQKIFSSELRQRIADVGMQVYGMHSLLSSNDPNSIPGDNTEKWYRTAPLNRFGGGASEVLRDVIAQRGHGMPSYGR
jgi:alkylation response protein AidB-like acyl-CoA dehydrogenase